MFVGFALSWIQKPRACEGIINPCSTAALENQFRRSRKLPFACQTRVLSDEKMNSFSVIRKKTPFQKHREEEEAKKKRADEEAARLYEEFVESFKGDDVPGGKAFVRGETINPDDPEKTGNEGMSSKEGASGSKKGSRYVPSFIPTGLAATSNKAKDPEKKKEEERPKEREKGRLRNIDNFMEELKAEQELRDKRNQVLQPIWSGFTVKSQRGSEYPLLLPSFRVSG